MISYTDDLTTFIPWLEVLPEYQRQGIGDELMRRVLADTDRFYSVDLVCDAELLRTTPASAWPAPPAPSSATPPR